jgi:alkylation response protein AidB-like acyl-CoA dehydrogenase
MELEFSADQDELRDAIRAVLGKENPVALARKVAEGGEAPTALWHTFAQLGWPALTVPEADGGIGLGMVEAGILAEELGRVVAPGPLLCTVTQFVPAIRELGSAEQRARFLEPVAAGTRSGSLAIIEPGTRSARYVMEGDTVDDLVVIDGEEAFVVATDGLPTTPVHAFDRTRRMTHVDLSGVSVADDCVLGTATTAGIARALEEATVGIALEMVGASQTLFDITLEYAKQREQFGVPIGSFQAIKHKFADMMIALERARATAYFAALTIAEHDERRALATSVAKVAAGDCQRVIAKEGIQIHGGIGYTWEHDVQLYVKRIKSGEQLFGTRSAHKARIADLLRV